MVPEALRADENRFRGLRMGLGTGAVDWPRVVPGTPEESAERVGTGLEGQLKSLGIRSFEARIGGFQRGTVGGVRRLRDEMRLLGNLSGAAGG